MRLGKILRVIAFNLLLLLCLALGIEIFLQIVPPFDRIITYADAHVTTRHRGPDQEYVYRGNRIGTLAEFEVTVRTNSLGFHDREYTFEKRPGAYRIVVLGDSQVFARQVPLEQTFHEILEQSLRDDGVDTDVIAIGRAGYGPGDVTELYETIGRRFAPDLVVWSCTRGNDIADSHRLLKDLIIARQRSRVPDPPEFLEPSKLVALFLGHRWPWSDAATSDRSFEGEFAALNDLQRWPDLVYLAQPPPIVQEAWEAFRRDLLRLIEAVAADGSSMIVISTAAAVPDGLAHRYPDLDWDFDKPDRTVRELAEQHSVVFLSMRTIFTDFRERTKRGVAYPNDGHLSAAGHRLVADVLHRQIAADTASTAR